MRKKSQLSIRAGLALAATIAGLSAQAQGVTVIKTGVIDNGEQLCFAFQGGKTSGTFAAGECSYYAGVPESGLVYENQRIRSVNAPGLTLVPLPGGRLQFRTGDSPDRAFLFDDNYLGELGWRAMHPDNAAGGQSCLQVQKSPSGTSFALVVQPSCTQPNLPENQVWLETLQPPPRPMFLKVEWPIKGAWPNPASIAPGEDTSALPRLCAGFDSTSQTWVFDGCDKLSVNRKDARLQYIADQSIRNASGQCLTRKTTVGTEVSFENCVTPNDYQRFAPANQHGGDPFWSAVVATAGMVDGGSRLSSGEMQPVTPNTPSAGCLAVNPSSSRMFFAHCETYTYQGNYRTLRGAPNTMSILDVPN